MDASLLQPGQVVLGKYRIDRVLGKGGMGLVLAATHLALRQEVAIKIMLPGQTLTAEHHDRFLREARASARLKSRHVVKVLDVGQTETGAPYMVMELLAGKDLEKMLEERRRLPVAEAIGYVLQGCEAVAEAHAAGVVHRDLKPANLFVSSDVDGSACVKVLDFGVSKLSNVTQGLTQERQALGTPYYMSPEQLISSRTVDARSDVWALGIIVYQLVTGELPFHKADNLPELVALILHTQAVPLTQVDPSFGPLWSVLERALEKNREKRYRNVYELAAALAPLGPPDAHAYVARIAAVLGEASLPPAPSPITSDRVSSPQVAVSAMTPPLSPAPAPVPEASLAATSGASFAARTGTGVGTGVGAGAGASVGTPAFVAGGTLPVGAGPSSMGVAANPSTLGPAAAPVPTTTISRKMVFPLIGIGMLVPILIGSIVLFGMKGSPKALDAGAPEVGIKQETSASAGVSASASATPVVSVGPAATPSISAAVPKVVAPGPVNKVKPPPVAATATDNPYGRK